MAIVKRLILWFKNSTLSSRVYPFDVIWGVHFNTSERCTIRNDISLSRSLRTNDNHVNAVPIRSCLTWSRSFSVKLRVQFSVQ